MSIYTFFKSANRYRRYQTALYGRQTARGYGLLVTDFKCHGSIALPASGADIIQAVEAGNGFAERIHLQKLYCLPSGRVTVCACRSSGQLEPGVSAVRLPNNSFDIFFT